LSKLKSQDWAESWKRHFKPLEIGSALLIKPSWNHRIPRKGQALVVLDPGLSFGTGQHPTTAFCLKQLAARRHSGRRQSLLDIGTGSGILAISAAKIGYGPVRAFDFDPQSIRIARENARRNRQSRKIQFLQQDVSKLPARASKKYSVICANLISTLLVAQCGRILARLEPEGTLIVAGILKDEFDTVRRAYEKAGLALVASRVEKEWRSASFRWEK
jgi:ribosomal protein L11 methyltransferase